MREAQVVALIVALWLIGSVVDVVLLPSANYSVVYVVPVVIAATQATPRTVAITSIVVLLTDIFDIYQSHTPASIWTVTLLSLIIICAMSVWVAQIRQRLAQYAREQHGLVQSAEALVGAPTLDRVATVIAEQAQRVLSVAAIYLWEVDREHAEWRMIASRGVVGESERPTLRIPFDSGSLLNQVLQTNDIAEIADLSTLDPTLKATRDVATRQGFRSVLAQPLSANGEVIGAISYFSRVPRRFSPHDRTLIRPLGSLWALAIENAHLHDEAIHRAEEAERAHQHLQRFLSLVAHDLRGPLTVVIGYTQLLLRHEPGARSEVEIRGLQTIDNAASQMQRLVQDLLDAARIGAGHFTVEPEPMDLAVLLRQIVTLTQVKTPTHQLILEAPEHLEGIWDPVRLRQVIDNLLSNAIKYSPQARQVLVQARSQGNDAIFCVTDYGVGIAPEQVEQLFQPFGRLSQTREVPGLGLGLYITKGIVEALHGRIWVESAIGRGSTFCVALPIRPAGDRAKEMSRSS